MREIGARCLRIDMVLRLISWGRGTRLWEWVGVSVEVCFGEVIIIVLGLVRRWGRVNRMGRDEGRSTGGYMLFKLGDYYLQFSKIDLIMKAEFIPKYHCFLSLKV